MTDASRYSDTGADAGHGSPPRMPRWVKVAAVVVGILILLFVVLTLAGVGGDHGPGRHMSEDGSFTEVAEQTEDGRAALQWAG